MASQTRKPFKSPPMRSPGDSIRERMRERLARHVLSACFVIAAIGFCVGLNTGIQIGARFLAPLRGVVSLSITGACLLFIGAAGWWFFRRMDATEPLDKNDRLGIEGEQIVAEALEGLKREGYRIFHDVPPEREAVEGESLANFDHVVVGPAGVFAIETKTRSKTPGENKIVVTADGRTIVNGHAQDRCPITQAQTLARVLQNMLEHETAMKSVPVRPVVLFPGWYIDDQAYRRAGGEVWTLNEQAFGKWLRKESVRLRPDEIALLASRIEMRVRAQSGTRG